MSYIDVTGKTEDEALRKGLEQLGMDRDDVSVSILERAKSGFLGIGASPARIRITYGPEEAEVAAPAEVKIIPEEKPAAPVQPAPAKAEERRRPFRQVAPISPAPTSRSPAAAGAVRPSPSRAPGASRPRRPRHRPAGVRRRQCQAHHRLRVRPAGAHGQLRRGEGL